MNLNQHCLGHVLTTAGYSTGYIGKWHLYANELCTTLRSLSGMR